MLPRHAWPGTAVFYGNRHQIYALLQLARKCGSIIFYISISFSAIQIKGLHAGVPEYITSEEPPPSSAAELDGPLSTGLKKEKPIRREVSEVLKKLPPFWRDSLLKLHLRSYYLDRNNLGNSKSEAWAAGGRLAYESGWWKERLQIGAVGYTSQKLYGPQSRDGTLLLKPGQEDITVLGQAYVNARVTDTTRLVLFRQTFNLPYVNKQDSRMVPNTFEAYTFGRKGIPPWDFNIAHVTKIKKRDASKFIPMSEAAGFKNTDEGLTMVGVRYNFSDQINLGAINQYSWEFMNTFYTEGNSIWHLTDEIPINGAFQFTHQSSVGDELGGDFNTYVFGGRLAGSYKGAVLNVAFSSTDDNSGIRSPYGGYPGFLSFIIKDFNRAGEDAFSLGLSYDFAELGIEGLSFFTNYARGFTPDTGPAASPDQEEFDFTLDYRPEWSFLKGLWLRLRVALVDQEGEGAVDVNDYRFILNYQVPIF